MRRSVVIFAALAFASIARAQDPGVAVKDFDQKHGGTEKMKMMAHVPAHPGAWKAGTQLSRCSIMTIPSVRRPGGRNH